LVRLVGPRPRTTRGLDETVDRVRIPSGSRHEAARTLGGPEPSGHAPAPRGCVDSSRSCRDETTHPPRARPGVSTHPGHAGTRRHTRPGAGRVCRLMTVMPGRVDTPDRRGEPPLVHGRPRRLNRRTAGPRAPRTGRTGAPPPGRPPGRHGAHREPLPRPPDQRPFRPRHTPPPPTRAERAGPARNARTPTTRRRHPARPRPRTGYRDPRRLHPTGKPPPRWPPDRRPPQNPSG